MLKVLYKSGQNWLVCLTKYWASNDNELILSNMYILHSAYFIGKNDLFPHLIVILLSLLLPYLPSAFETNAEGDAYSTCLIYDKPKGSWNAIGYKQKENILNIETSIIKLFLAELKNNLKKIKAA